MWYNCAVWFEITAANRSSVPKSNESRKTVVAKVRYVKGIAGHKYPGLSVWVAL